MPIDPRANAPEHIAAPAPLPHVSRRALKRVKNPLPAPTHCRYCSGEVKLVNNSVIYNREYGDWPYMYLCFSCDSYVGLHPDTDIPLGTLANAALCKDRNLSKDLFFRVSKQRGMSRTLAYQWLAGKMGIPVDQCHFGWFEQKDCGRAAVICVDDLEASTNMATAFSKARRRA